jgi:LPS export ABC transporter protein LptC
MKQQQLDSKTYRLIKNIRIAVLSLGTAILVFACSDNEIDKIQAFHAPENLPVLESLNFETIFTDSGIVRFSLKAPKLLRFENEGKMYHEFPEGMRFVKYNENREIISSIEADYAREYIKDKKWEAKNNVIVTNEKGDSLKTEHLIWEENTEKIYTEEFVKIISETKTITGIGLTSDQDMKNWKLKKPKGTIYVDVNTNKQNTEESVQSESLNKAPKTEQNGQQPLIFK